MAELRPNPCLGSSVLSRKLEETSVVRSRKALAVYLIFGLLLIVLTRLPQLTTPLLNLDGDEAIVALMAKHVNEGQSLPIFFLGQCYGFSLFEVATASLLFHHFGLSATTLKVAMLLLWGLGWVFFVLAVRRLTNLTIASIAGCLLIFCPAWSAWSMMARGGYVTAFMLTNFGLWIFSNLYRHETSKEALYAVLGICLALLFFAQPISLLSFCPFVVVLMYKDRSISTAFVLSSCVIATMALILWAATVGESSCYWSLDPFRGADILQALHLLPERLWVSLSGIYYFSEHEINRGAFAVICASLWWLSSIALLLRTLQISIEKKRNELTFASFVAILVVFACTLPIGSFGYRYFLAIPCLLLFFFSVDAVACRPFSSYKKTVTVVFVGVLVVSGAIALIEAGNYSRSWEITFDSANVEAEDALIRDLLANEIEHVYCLHPMFQWNIMWRSRERIVARWLHPADRYPEYPQTVDRAFFSGGKVAIVGTAFQLNQLEQIITRHWPGGVPYEIVSDRYFWIPAPTAQLLISLGFRLNDPNE